MVEQQIVALTVVGSSPIVYPKFFVFYKFGQLVQLEEHLAYNEKVSGSSPLLPISFEEVAQLVRVVACHANCRWFKSSFSRE